jgi:hypothetical protein
VLESAQFGQFMKSAMEEVLHDPHKHKESFNFRQFCYHMSQGQELTAISAFIHTAVLKVMEQKCLDFYESKEYSDIGTEHTLLQDLEMILEADTRNKTSPQDTPADSKDIGEEL